MSNKEKMIVILGPTASGKTKLAVELAKKYQGEIISADSRQVYRGMDVGSGKDLKEYVITDKKRGIVNISYHLIDVVSPKTKFSLARYQKLAFKAIDDILKRGKLPILVGGSGLYLEAVVDNYNLSGVKPDLGLRKKLEQYSEEKIFQMIGRLDDAFAKKINNSDKNNKRRLMRYYEILKGDRNFESRSLKKKYKALVLGLTWPKEKIEERILKRLQERLENEGIVEEVERLKSEGISWKRLESFGLEYKFIAQFLQNRISYEEMRKKIFITSRQFAKRQMTWFKRWEKRGAKIDWLKDNKGAERYIKKFLKI